MNCDLWCSRGRIFDCGL